MVKLYEYQSKKCLEGNTVLPKFCGICSNHHLLVLFGNEKKFCLKLKVKTKKRSPPQPAISKSNQSKQSEDIFCFHF